MDSRGIVLTYSESLKLGIPFDRECPTDEDHPLYDEHCSEKHVITRKELEDDISAKTRKYPKLFVPRNDRTVFNSGFVRCPERVSLIKFVSRSDFYSVLVQFGHFNHLYDVRRYYAGQLAGCYVRYYLFGVY